MTIEQVVRHSAVLGGGVGLGNLLLLLFVHSKSLLQLDLFRKALLVQQLGTKTGCALSLTILIV